MSSLSSALQTMAMVSACICNPRADHVTLLMSPSTFITNNKLPCAPVVAVVASARRRRRLDLSASSSRVTNGVTRDGVYKVGEFMTKKEDLHVVKTTTPVDEAWANLVDKRITGFPVIDDDWNLVGVISDYDLLVIDSISGGCQSDPIPNLFPDVGSSWTAFNEIQKLLIKSHGKVVGDLMTPNPLTVHQNTNLEEAARLLLQTKYHRLPVVNRDGKLVGIITRGDVVRAALQIKRVEEN